MTKGAKCRVAWHVQVTVWCFLAMAMTTLTQRSDAARATSWRNIGSEAGNVDEEASSSPNVTAEVKSSAQISTGNTEQENFELDEQLAKLLEAADKPKTELVVLNSHIEESGSEFVVHEQNTVGESRDSNGYNKIRFLTIIIIIRNQIPDDPIRAVCQSQKDGTVVQDYDLVNIPSNHGYIWTAAVVDDGPDLMKCVIYWDRHDLVMTYAVYQGDYTEQSIWHVDPAGLYKYVADQGYVMMQPWVRELQVGKMLH